MNREFKDHEQNRVHTGGNNRNTGGSNRRVEFGGDKNCSKLVTGVCDFCRVKGHLAEECFQIMTHPAVKFLNSSGNQST